MQIHSKPSSKNSQPTDNSKNANAAPLSTLTTEPRRRDRWKHNARAIAPLEAADRDQLQLF
jgi:hypothetical protein